MEYITKIWKNRRKYKKTNTYFELKKLNELASTQIISKNVCFSTPLPLDPPLPLLLFCLRDPFKSKPSKTLPNHM